ITVCINYNESLVINENNLKLFHYENGSWVNITTSLDTSANLICGTVTSLSPFIVAEPLIQATIDIDSDDVRLGSRGGWITAYIELPAGYDVNNINVSTVRLNGVVPADPKTDTVGDRDKDGIPDMKIRFDKAEVVALLNPGDNLLTLTGSLTDGTPFKGSDTLQAIG
ncbi:MAG: hypothetical protein AABX40_04020, partial [Candidatus Hydrothermarchaeota archaeon]